MVADLTAGAGWFCRHLSIHPSERKQQIQLLDADAEPCSSLGHGRRAYLRIFDPGPPQRAGCYDISTWGIEAHTCRKASFALSIIPLRLEWCFSSYNWPPQLAITTHVTRVEVDAMLHLHSVHECTGRLERATAVVTLLPATLWASLHQSEHSGCDRSRLPSCGKGRRSAEQCRSCNVPICC